MKQTAPVKTHPSQYGGGRRNPEYTQIGIERLFCSVKGCGRKGYATWSGCADGNIRRPLCAEHDIEINRIVQEWWGDPDWEEKIVNYANSVAAQIDRPLEIDWLIPK